MDLLFLFAFYPLNPIIFAHHYRLQTGKMSNPSESPPPNLSNQLCSSCDGCRARKTKCDGQSPCASCVSKYVKKHKVPKEEVTAEDCGCSYSMAKRRGPQPGFKAKKKREDGDGELHLKKKRKKSNDQINSNMRNMNFGMGAGPPVPGNIPLPLDPGSAALQQQILSGLGAIGKNCCIRVLLYSGIHLL